jgi:hypothetical protein
MVVRQKLLRARNVARSPADVWLFARMLGWAAALPVLKRRVPLVTLVETAAPANNSHPARDPETAIALARWVYKIPALRDNCLEKSLLTYHFLPAARSDYSLVLGFRGVGGTAPPGHAWLVVGGQPVHDTWESLADLTPVVAFDAHGRRQDPSEGASRAPGGAQGRAETEEQDERPGETGDPETQPPASR